MLESKSVTIEANTQEAVLNINTDTTRGIASIATISNITGSGDVKILTFWEKL